MTTFHLCTIAVTSTALFIFTHDIHEFDSLIDAIQEYQTQGAQETPGTEIAVYQPPETDVTVIRPVNTDLGVIKPDEVPPKSPQLIEPALQSSQLQPSTGVQSLEPAIPSSQLLPSAGVEGRDYNTESLTRELSVQSAPGALETNARDYDSTHGININTNPRRIKYTSHDLCHNSPYLFFSFKIIVVVFSNYVN